MELKLSEIAERIARSTGREEKSVYNTVRKIRDRGILSNSSVEGTTALYPRTELVKAAIMCELMQHGLDGIALQKISRCLENQNATPSVGVVRSIGFTRVVDGIIEGEVWLFRFHAKGLKNYVGGCRMEGSELGNDAVERAPIHVSTTVNLNAITQQLGLIPNENC